MNINKRESNSELLISV